MKHSNPIILTCPKCKYQTSTRKPTGEIAHCTNCRKPMVV